MAETKYNILTRLLKDLRNQVSSSGDIGGKSNGGGVPVVHAVMEETVAISGTLPDVDGYEWIPRQSSPSGEVTEGPFIQIDYDASVLIPEVFIKPTDRNDWVHISDVTSSSGTIKIDVSEFGMDGRYPSEEYFNGALIKVVTESNTRLDKTYKELVESGFFVVHAANEKYPNNVVLMLPVGFRSDELSGCAVGILDLNDNTILPFVASTENDYPVLHDLEDPDNSGYIHDAN